MESGAAAVEFALVLVPFLTVLFGMIQYGLYFYSAQTGSQVANTAVRQLSVGNCISSSDPATDPPALQSYVKDQLGAASSDPAGVTTKVQYWDPTTTPPAGPYSYSAAKVGYTVELTLTFPTLNMHFPFVPFLTNSTVSRTVEARLEDMTSAGCPA